MPETFEQELRAAIHVVARTRPLTPEFIQHTIPRTTVSSQNPNSQLKALAKIARDDRAQDNLGKLRATVLTGTTLLGKAFIRAAEREGILICEESAHKKWGQFLEALLTEVRVADYPAWSLLSERLPSYCAYQRLVAARATEDRKALRVLRARPRHIIKQALALTELAFLRHYLDFEVPERLADWFEELGSPEEVASVVSLLVDRANKFCPLESSDFTKPETGDLLASDVHAVMDYGRALSYRHEVAKHLSLFGYRLEATSRGKKWLFYLRPASMQIEYGQRLGFIRSKISWSAVSIEITKQDKVPQLSLRTAADVVLARFHHGLCEVRDADRPIRRMRFNIPSGASIYNLITDTPMHDEEAYLERLGRDFLIPPTSEAAAGVRLADHLDLNTFYRIWKYIKFSCLLSIAATRKCAKTDFELLCNSVLRVIPEDAMIDMITQAGLSIEQATEFLTLVSADVRNLGYFDLQYRPFLRIASSTMRKPKITTDPEIVFFPAAVAAANEVRNVQSANKIRVKASGSIFVKAVGNVLRKRFNKVALERRVETSSKKTDVDVVILEKQTLYLFECKHSMPPTNPHEMRDLWEDIEKGCRQLSTAMEILQDRDCLLDFLAGWFPGTTRRDIVGLTVSPCVLCSHRIYSGIYFEGIPVRDFSSLDMLAERGTVGIGWVDENHESVTYNYRIISESGFGSADLTEYLSAESRFFKMFAPFMRQVSRFEVVANITMASETYRYETSLGELLAHLEALGLVRLPEVRIKLTPPWSSEDLLSALEQSSTNRP
jgi:hypothetical protein